MIIPNDETNCDAADGSKGPLKDRVAGPRERSDEFVQHWADDGGAPAPADGFAGARGGSSALPSEARADKQPGPGEFVTKPSWTNQSLRDLNAAIRREASAPARQRREADRLAGEQARRIRIHEVLLVAALRAERDRYRNAWENT